MSITTLITADQFDTMSFDEPVELIRGEIVFMTRPGGIHGCVCGNVDFALQVWARSTTRFVVMPNDTGVQTESEPDSIRGPDLLVVDKELLGEPGLPQGRLTVAPEVVVEVKSPSNSWRELVEKSVEFLSAGVKEVWIVDPESRHVHVYKENTEPTTLSTQDTITSEFLPEFSCQIAEFFLNLPTQTEAENK